MPPQPLRPSRHAVIAAVLCLLIAGLIGHGTLTPPGTDPSGLPLSDKQLHALAFALLVLPAGWVWPHRAIWTAAAALAYGGFIEVVQPGIGRTAEWGDLAADAAGIVIGLLPGQLRRRRRG